MRIASSLEAHVLGLPPPRCRAVRSRQWVAMSDGVRLATHVYRPELPEPRTTLLVRVAAKQPVGALARLLSEQGHRVVVQECRGLAGSEGRFEPFLRDGADGADTLDWLAAQPFAGGPTAVSGFGYPGHAAWATLAAARQRVDGLLVGFATRDPFAWLHTGGALELEHAFALALSLAAAEREGVGTRDVARAVRFRPLVAADRVAARRIDWLREWLDHPQRDDFWKARTPRLPERPPAALLIGGLHHPTLAPLLADHAALADAARAAGSIPPRLLVGPWPAADQRSIRQSLAHARQIAGAALALLDAIEAAAPARPAPVRIFGGGGAGWRELADWPPETDPRVLYLRGDGRADDGGRLLPEPAEADERADAFVHDPADPVPSEGGASGSAPGAVALSLAESRGDVLRYVGDPLPSACELSGSARVALYVSSDAPASDLTARLARIDPSGTPFHLCDGIARVEELSGSPVRVEIALAPAFHRLHAGERLRLEVASSSFPRFDRHANTAAPQARVSDEACRAALHRVHHDARLPSRIELPLAGCGPRVIRCASPAGSLSVRKNGSGPPVSPGGPDLESQAASRCRRP